MVEAKNLPPATRPGKPGAGAGSATATACQLNPSGHVYHVIEVQNTGSSNNLNVGAEGSQPVVLVPGAAQLFRDCAPNEIWVNSASGTTYGWLGYGRHLANETDS